MQKIILACIFLFGAAGSSLAQQLSPVAYWQFEIASPGHDYSNNLHQLVVPTPIGPEISLQNPVVGAWLDPFLPGANFYHSNPLITIPTLKDSSMVSVEFLMKTGPEFDRAIPVSWDGRISFFIYDEQIRVDVILVGNTLRRFEIPLDGVGRRDSRYHTNGNWHHYAVSYSAKTGWLRVYVDGISPPGFAKNFGPSAAIDPGGDVDFTPVIGNRLSGGLDEVAIYDTILSDNWEYFHYLNSIRDHQHYQFLWPTGYAENIPATNTNPSERNALDFAHGYPNITQSSIELLLHYPAPRYNSRRKMPLLLPWISDFGRLAGNDDYYDAANIQRDLVRNYHYMIHLGQAHWFDTLVNPLNINPDNRGKIFLDLSLEAEFEDVPRFLITDWDRTPHQVINYQGDTLNEIYLHRPDMDYYDPDYYLFSSQTSSYVSRKIFGPLAPADSLRRDGLVIRKRVNHIFTYMNLLNPNNRGIDFISENGEVFSPNLRPQYPFDPKVQLDKLNYPANAFAEHYYSAKKAEWATEYSTAFRTSVDSVNALSGRSPSDFQWYDLAAEIPTVARLEEFLPLTTPFTQKDRTSSYFYPQLPRYFRNHEGSLNGLDRYQKQLRHAIDSTQIGLAYPFVSPGYFDDSPLANYSDEKIIRPGQYLALLKALGALGADTYTNFMYYGSSGSNIVPPWQGNWRIWKAVMPAYAQGVTSRAKEFWYSGTLLPGSGELLGGPGRAIYDHATGSYTSRGHKLPF
ncbi:MAG: hypothetical protein H6581_31060 [Bacteroidia bacterium]|nr:hypothetical protein [Bacteroidia bacterium]